MFKAALALLTAMMAASPAHAHVFGASGAGFGAGFGHPFSGIDHLLAMVGLGVVASILGGKLRWGMPIAFIGFMCAGAVLALAGGKVPAVETGIAVSVIVLGGLIAVARRGASTWAAVAVAAFAVFHGHAHGSEIPEAAWPLAYAAGFVLATASLHLAGIAAGDFVQRLGRLPRQATGAVVAFAGIFLLI